MSSLVAGRGGRFVGGGGWGAGRRFGEIVATYRNDHVYLFNTKDYNPGRERGLEVCIAVRGSHTRDPQS